MSAPNNILVNMCEIELRSAKLLQEWIDDNIRTSENVGNAFAKLSSNYNHFINEFLLVYAEIDYGTNAEYKVELKGELKYAYDFLELSMSIVKLIEHIKKPNGALFSMWETLDGYISRRDKLVHGEYMLAARQELITFHNTDFRAKLSANLSKKSD